MVTFNAPGSKCTRTAEDSQCRVRTPHRPCLCSTGLDSGCALDHAFTHHWRVSYNKRARLGGEEERALSRVNGARHLTLSAPISAQRGAHASTAHARWASSEVGDLRTALLYSSRAQRFLFPVVLFPLTINWQHFDIHTQRPIQSYDIHSYPLHRVYTSPHYQRQGHFFKIKNHPMFYQKLVDTIKWVLFMPQKKEWLLRVNYCSNLSGLPWNPKFRMDLRNLC